MINSLKFLSLLTMLILSMASVNAQNSETAVAIMLERTACRGICPVYIITILENGTVVYRGEDFVEVTEEQTSQIDPETVERMVEAFAAAGYFDWDETYTTQTVSDLPTIITSVSRKGWTQRIERYAGDYSAPLALPFLENWIDEMTNTWLWTGIQPDPGAISNGVSTPSITLQRNACFGTCPVYSVAIFENGTVIYTGIANVAEIGVRTFETDTTVFNYIAQQAQIFGYFDWQDSYEERIRTDQATVITLIRLQDQSKRIVRYEGDSNTPIGLVWIEESIAQVVKELIG